MSKLELDISDLSRLPDAAKKLIEFSGHARIFAFNGGMGSGKTTFIKELCKTLGSQDDFSSPTYSIVNEYKLPKGKIFHFDLYRVQDTNELYDLGFEEYLQSGDYCFIEWPELGQPFFLTPYVTIIIQQKQNIRYFCAEIIE